MIEKGKGMAGGDSAYQSYQGKLLKMDEELAAQQDTIKEMKEGISELESQSKEGKKNLTVETAKLRNELKTVKENMDTQTKLVQSIKKDVDYILQAQKIQAETIERMEKDREIEKSERLLRIDSKEKLRKHEKGTD